MLNSVRSVMLQWIESWSVLQPGQPVNFSDDHGMFDCTFVNTFTIFLSSYSRDKLGKFFLKNIKRFLW